MYIHFLNAHLVGCKSVSHMQADLHNPFPCLLVSTMSCVCYITLRDGNSVLWNVRCKGQVVLRLLLLFKKKKIKYR